MHASEHMSSHQEREYGEEFCAEDENSARSDVQNLLLCIDPFVLLSSHWNQHSNQPVPMSARYWVQLTRTPLVVHNRCVCEFSQLLDVTPFLHPCL